MKEKASGSYFFLANLIFFVSGFCALLYQVAWHRLLTPFAGSDVRSATIVVAAFLGGLGAGSLVSRLYIDRLAPKSAFVIFGLSNLLIGLYGAFSKFLFYDTLVSGSSLAGSSLIGFGVVFICLLFPTSLMGMSLPLLVKALIVKIELAGAQIGRLYSINTWGSVLGAFVGGWLLVSLFGYEGTLFIASGFSFSAGLVSLFLAKGLFPVKTRHTARQTHKQVPSQGKFKILFWGALVLISGFAAVSLEIIWLRVLGVMLVTNAYTFAHLLAFILAGYALGGLVGAASPRPKDPARAFLAVLVLAIASAVVLIWSASLLWPQYSMSFSDASAPWFVDFFLIPVLLLCLPNFFFGLAFVYLQKGIQTDNRYIGSRVSILLALNTIGNVLGSVLTGLVFLHYFGTSGTIRILLLIGLGLVLLLIARSPKPRTGFVKLLPAVMLGIALFLFPSNTDFWVPLHLGKVRESASVISEDSTGVSALILGSPPYSITVSGEEQGYFDYEPGSVHSLLGMLGPLIHPSPERILIIGIGSGATPVWAGINPDTNKIRAVEIVGSEIPLLVQFSQMNPDHPVDILFEDSRFELAVGDGRKDLILSSEKYDVIEADAIRPWKSGSGFLYSVEFFEEARDALNPGGLMVQWAPSSRIRNTFYAVFPYVLEYRDYIMIGSMEPIDLNFPEIQERFNDRMLGTEYLTRLGVSFSVSNIVSEIQPGYAVNPLDINTDLFPKDENYLVDEAITRIFEIAENYRQQKNFVLASRYYRLVSELDPGNTEVLDRLLHALEKSNQLNLIEEPLFELISLKEAELEVWKTRRDLFMANGFESQQSLAQDQISLLENELLKLYRQLQNLP